MRASWKFFNVTNLWAGAASLPVLIISVSSFIIDFLSALSLFFFCQRVIQCPLNVMSLNMNADVGIRTGSRDIPPYVTMTPLLTNVCNKLVALLPPTQLSASFGFGMDASREMFLKRKRM